MAAARGEFIGRRFLRSVAIHESGHACASRLCGLRVAGTSIEYRNGHHGATWADDGIRDDDAPGEAVVDLVGRLHERMPKIGEARDDVAVDLLRCGDEVIALLSGIEAEKRFGGGELLRGTAHDLIEARAVASLLCRSPSSVDAYLAFAEAEAAALLTAHADALMRVADALLIERTILAARIDELIRG